MIDSYSFGNISIDGKKYIKDLIIFPDRIRENWWRNTGHLLTLDDMEEILEAKPDLLIIGTGITGLMKIDAKVIDKLKELGIDYRIAETVDAVKEYNKVYQDKKTVFAMHLTC